MENFSFNDTNQIQPQWAPYLYNTLIPQGFLYTSYSSVPGHHPSLPNYLDLCFGQNFLTCEDIDPFKNSTKAVGKDYYFFDAKHVGDQLEAKGLDWRSWQENINGTVCPLQPSSALTGRRFTTPSGPNTGYGNNPICTLTCNVYHSAQCVCQRKTTLESPD